MVACSEKNSTNFSASGELTNKFYFRRAMRFQRLSHLMHTIFENSNELTFNKPFGIYYQGLPSDATALLRDKPVGEEVCVDVLLKLWKKRKILSSGCIQDSIFPHKIGV